MRKLNHPRNNPVLRIAGVVCQRSAETIRFSMDALIQI